MTAPVKAPVVVALAATAAPVNTIEQPKPALNQAPRASPGPARMTQKCQQ
jgi:hypothetical protein